MVDEAPSTTHDEGGASEALAREIKRRRDAAGLSQPQLARRISYTRQYVSLAERVGQNLPSPSLIQALDRALDAQGALIALRNQAKNEQHGKRRQISDAPFVNEPLIQTISSQEIGQRHGDGTQEGEERARQHPSWWPWPPQVGCPRSGGKLNPLLVGTGPVEDLIVQREVTMAAAESARFGQFAEQSNVGPHTLEQFRADLTRIVTTYPNRPVYPMFVELRALRNRAFELLEGRQYPEQSRELYLVAGALCGVLANASFDLGWLHAAETQARTAFLCAELAGNNALRVWVRGMQSLVAYWDGRPRVAVELAADGWRYAPETGTARVRLAAIEARAHAQLRDRRGAENALARAAQAREEIRGPDDPGGMLTFPMAKQHFYTATAQLWLGGQDSYTHAEREATHAVELYAADPPEQRRLGELCLARLDLAAARLGRDDLDGAADQLQDVLAIAVQRRTDSVSRRLHQVGRTLQRPKYQTSALALDLYDEIHSFTLGSAPPALPGADR